MSTRTPTDHHYLTGPSARAVVVAMALALAGVVLTRLPVARLEPFDFDEFGYLDTIELYRFPMHHTLFLASARALGAAVGDAYRGFVVLDMLASALALTACWWWLRALVGPRTAVAATVALGAGPVFWSYGAMAGNYTAIVLVGSLLLGIAGRGREQPRAWHPYAAAVAMAIGAGYRQDIGTFWLPVFLVILWQHRWLASALALAICAALTMAWFLPMLREVGGWASYRAASAEFAYKAGYLNSAWHLGWIDAPLRYALKGGMALAWTLGPGLLFAPRGLLRIGHREGGIALAGLLALSAAPAMVSHLFVHFGVAGYAMHYIPATIALVALGLARVGASAEAADASGARRAWALAASLAALFLLYPTDYDRPGLRGDFDLAFARHTRVGLRTRPPVRDPAAWRTINSQELPGGRRASERHTSLSQIWTP
jgi:hypothetical protein